MHYNNCIIHRTIDVLTEQGGPEVAQQFKRLIKKHTGINNLDGLPDADQIYRVNCFWKSLLEPIPNTTFIRSWLENGSNINEYILLFKMNWCKDVLASGALNR